MAALTKIPAIFSVKTLYLKVTSLHALRIICIFKAEHMLIQIYLTCAGLPVTMNHEL